MILLTFAPHTYTWPLELGRVREAARPHDGRERGLGNRELAEALGISRSAVTRRVEAARRRGAETAETVKLRKALKDLSNEIG